MKHSIQVRQYSGDTYVVLETVQRKLRAEAIGNFNPVFCRYKNNPRVLVHSDTGDLSDPFRRTQEHLTTLFIKV